MISPASFNYYQECTSKAKELENLALQAYTTNVIANDLLARARALMYNVPCGFLINR